jgi:hypothetical protein
VIICSKQLLQALFSLAQLCLSQKFTSMMMTGVRVDLGFECTVSLQILLLLLQQLGKAHSAAALDFFVPGKSA